MFSVCWITVFYTALICIELETGLLVEAISTLSHQQNSERNVYNLTEGQALSILVNVTDTDRRSTLGFYYVARDNPNDRVIKLPKGDAGNGTCYNDGPFYQQCETYFSLSYVEYWKLSRTVCFAIKNITKPMAGKYQLRPYYQWAIGNYSEDPLLQFTIYIQDVPHTTLEAPQKTTTGLQRPTELPTEINQETVAPVRDQGSPSGEKKKTDRSLARYFGIPIAIIFSALYWLVIITTSRRSKSRILTSQDV
ncbi:uncharacterized protein LOC144654749 isoform X1 [Oculina patagonica]